MSQPLRPCGAERVAVMHDGPLLCFRVADTVPAALLLLLLLLLLTNARRLSVALLTGLRVSVVVPMYARALVVRGSIVHGRWRPTAQPQRGSGQARAAGQHG